MSSTIHIENLSTREAKSGECDRIVQSLSKRISDFEESYQCHHDYTITLNPAESSLSDATKLKDRIYLQIDPISLSRDKDLGVLQGKLSLFRFESQGINNILIAVQEPGGNGSRNGETAGQTQYVDAVGCKLFENRVYRLVASTKYEGYNSFVCLVGDDLCSPDLFVDAFSKAVGRKIVRVSINDILKENTLLRKLFSKQENSIIYLSAFDYLFSDLSQTPKIANRELAMIRHDLLEGVRGNNLNTIILSVSSPLIVTKELSVQVYAVEDLTNRDCDWAKTVVKSQVGDVPNCELVCSLLSSLPNRTLLDVLTQIHSHSGKTPDFNVLEFVQNSIDRRKTVDAEFTKVEGGDFKITIPSVTLDRVVLSEENLEKLQMSLSSIVNQELVSHVWGWSEIDPNVRSIINFYGPPGTGKTLCANAIAHELTRRTGKEYRLLSLNYSEIESMYVGEAPKKLERVFNFAKDKNLVLFFDEADSFLGKRIQNVSQGSEQAINSLRSTMLIQLEKYTGVVIFATNLTTNYDSAFKTRFLAEIEFPLPNQETCKKIFVKNVPSKLHGKFKNGFLTEGELDVIAKELLGLSGRDIKTIIWRVLLRQSQIEGESHEFCSRDFLSEIEIYKKEKQTAPKVDPRKITASVTPASKEFAKKLGLEPQEGKPTETNNEQTADAECTNKLNHE